MYRLVGLCLRVVWLMYLPRIGLVVGYWFGWIVWLVWFWLLLRCVGFSGWADLLFMTLLRVVGGYCCSALDVSCLL